MAKRSLTRAGVSVALAVMLSACGFHLRGTLPPTMAAKSFYIEGLGRGDLFVREFSNILSYSGGSLAAAPSQAGAVIHIVQARQERRPIGLSKAGRANLYDLSYRVVYEVTTPQGEILLPRQEIDLKRDYFNDQTSPLSQTYEEHQIQQEMQREAAQLLFRRVAYALSRPPESKS
ncbi:LPS-assembly lipoprotein LptE [Methylocaldum szegediense]|uniref:LPS-assembly lipoprotein LptE n=1 Tax=Methylocaldum szegediense TaxID=73780 RepID=A0ABM9I6Q3_9GAMM|nr:LPS assembly lipoprotein LptE [Methylocaldum szegediense]CAI8929075.1 LPS-assembly lipoprotein LptE [Methylocaldum szegediense]